MNIGHIKCTKDKEVVLILLVKIQDLQISIFIGVLYISSKVADSG